jgi:hypothetical protein
MAMTDDQPDVPIEEREYEPRDPFTTEEPGFAEGEEPPWVQEEKKKEKKDMPSYPWEQDEE